MLYVGQLQTAGECVVLMPEGELDRLGAASLREVLAGLPPSELLLIDLSMTSFVDSAGIGALIGGIRRIREDGRHAILICDRPGLLKVLQASGIGDIAPIRASIEEAEAEFGPRADPSN